MEREGILNVALDLHCVHLFLPFFLFSSSQSVLLSYCPTSPPFATTGEPGSTVLTELVRRSGRGRGGRSREVAEHPRPAEGERQRRGGHRGRRGGDEGGQEDQQGLQDHQDIWSFFLILTRVLGPDPWTRYQTIGLSRGK